MNNLIKNDKAVSPVVATLVLLLSQLLVQLQ